MFSRLKTADVFYYGLSFVLLCCLCGFVRYFRQQAEVPIATDVRSLPSGVPETFVGFGSFHAQAETADQLWENYQDASINANAAANHYNKQVYAAKEVNDKISKNKKDLSDSTTSTLRNLFVAGGLYVLSAPTLFIPVLGKGATTKYL